MESSPGVHHITEDFGRLQSLLLTLTDVDDFLQQLAELAAGVVEPPASCGINTQVDGRPLTITSSDPRAARLDHTQFDLGDGPCLQAMRSGQVVHVVDTATDERWERYMTVAREEGVRCSLSLPLVVGGTSVGAMNFFASGRARAFDAEQQERCASFATQAAGAMELAIRSLGDAAVRRQLEEALTPRAVIDQAMGILIGQQGCSADAAFAELRRRSIDANQRLRDVATDLVRQASGQEPSDGRPFRTDEDPGRGG